MREITRLARGVHYWKTPGGRYVLRLHYGSIPAHDNDEWRAKEQDRINCGPKSPEWQTEYEINPDARRGILLFPDWDERLHVGRVTPRTNRHWYQVCGIDYGTRAPTAMLFGSWNGLWLRIWHEHYFKGRNSAWHKAQMAQVLSGMLGLDPNSEELFQVIRYTFADPTSMLDLEYMHAPQPWVHLSSIGSKRLNDVKSGEDAMHNFLQRRGACCDMVLYQTSDVCDSRGRFWATCPKCGEPARLRMGLKADLGCVYFRHQMRTLRVENPKEGEEISEKKQPKQANHSTDAGRYLVHGLSELLDPTVIQKRKVVEKSYGTRYHFPKSRKTGGAVARAYG